MIAIKNATLVMKDHLIPEAVLFVEDGLIKDFGGMQPRDPGRPWRGALASGHKPR